MPVLNDGPTLHAGPNCGKPSLVPALFEYPNQSGLLMQAVTELELSLSRNCASILQA